jgi:hypothetical protein
MTTPPLIIVAPSDPCDRCGHPSRRHAAPESWSVCLVREGTDPKTGKPLTCWCDGFMIGPSR